MSQSRRPISEKLDQAIADIKAMAAGDRPINEDVLRWIWMVDDAATQGLEGAYQMGRLHEQPVVGQFHHLMRAVESHSRVKRAFLVTWARHVTSTAPDPERHYRLVVSVLDDLLAEHPDAQVAKLIPLGVEILHRDAHQGGAE